MTSSRQEFQAQEPGVTYECGPDLKLLAISPLASELLGIKPSRLLGNQSLWGERLLIEDRQRLVGRLESLDVSAVASEVHRLLDDRGLPVWVCHSFCKVGTGANSIVRGCIIPLPKRLRESELHDGSIAQFVHKIGNHFQLLNLLIGSLRRRVTSDEIDSLQQTVDRAAEFTRAFLHYCQVPSSLCEVDLGEVLHTVFYSNVPKFVESKVQFEDLIQDSLIGVLINGDPLLLELAFGAILRNALDATKSGERVTVSCKRHGSCSAANLVVQISIADTGVGIASDSLAKAVVPFYSTKPEQDGLGLSMAARIFDMHGGLLRIASAKERGTEVDIFLPVSDLTAYFDR